MIQFIKFGIVGATNAAVSYLTYRLSLLGLQIINCSPQFDYILASISSFIISVFWSFCLNNRYTFRAKENEHRSFWRSLLRSYICYGFTGLILNNILLAIWVQKIGISKEIAPIINIIISTPINFILNKYWAFKGAHS